MQLYRIELSNQHIISTFDSKGKKIGERTDIVKQVINDLPYATALMYKNKDGDRCVMIAQDMVSAKQHSGRSFEHRSSKPQFTSTAKKAPAARPSQTSIQRAAATGNMTAAINQGN